MNKSDFIKKMKDYSDAYITYLSPVSRKEKFNVGTMDFENDYIKKKAKAAISRVDSKRILVFCWDTDSYKQIDYTAVTKVEPLSQAIERSRGGRQRHTG